MANTPDPTGGVTGTVNALTWLSSWLAIILTLTALAQLEWGKRVVYYLAWLAIVFLVVTHSSEVTSLFGTFAQPPSQSGQS